MENCITQSTVTLMEWKMIIFKVYINRLFIEYDTSRERQVLPIYYIEETGHCYLRKIAEDHY